MFFTREALLILVRESPERFVDLFLDLQARLIAIEQRLAQNSNNSNRPPSSDGYRKPAPKSLRKSCGLPSGGQKGHPGKTLVQIAQPDQIVVHPLAVCSCGADLSKVSALDPEKRQVFDLPDPKLQVTEHQAQTKVCPSCSKQVTALFPEEVLAPVQYGPSFKAFLVYLRDGQFLPLNRISQLCGDLFGYSVSEGTIESARKACYARLEPFEHRLKELLRTSELSHVDESGLRVFKGLSWLHVQSTNLLTFYGVHEKRGQEALDSFGILPFFQGTLVHDFWKPYLNYDCSHAFCNAHLLREMKFLKEECGQVWAGQMSDLLLDMHKNRNAKTLSTWKRSYRKILLEGELKNLDPPSRTGSRSRFKKTKAQNLLARLRSYQNSILAFLRDPQLPFTNNQAEQDIRMVKVQQKISGSFRTFTGAKLFARIRSYISTVRKQKLNALKQIIQTLSSQTFIPQMT